MNNIKIPKEIKNGQNIYIVNQKRNLSLKDTIKKVSLLQKTITNYKNQATKNKKNSIALMVDENTNINNKDKYKKTFKRKLTHSPKKKRKTQKIYLKMIKTKTKTKTKIKIVIKDIVIQLIDK